MWGRKQTKHLPRGARVEAAMGWEEDKQKTEYILWSVLKQWFLNPLWQKANLFFFPICILISRQCQIAIDSEVSIEVSKCLLSMSTFTSSPAAGHTVWEADKALGKTGVQERWGAESRVVEWVSENHSVMSESLWSHGLYRPWNSPGQNTGVGSLFLLPGIFPTPGSKPGLPCCRRILYQLSHKGSPKGVVSEKLISEQRFEGGEGESHTCVWSLDFGWSLLEGQGAEGRKWGGIIREDNGIPADDPESSKNL